MHIRPVEISQPDGICCSYGLVADQHDDKLPPVLVVSFSGTYPPGSLGNAHGRFMAHATVHGLAAFNPWCVLLDLRELRYEWGNTLLAVFEQITQYSSDASFPVVVVTSGKCRDAFLSLVRPAGAPAPDWHFEDLDAALECAVQKANEWIDA